MKRKILSVLSISMLWLSACSSLSQVFPDRNPDSEPVVETNAIEPAATESPDAENNIAEATQPAAEDPAPAEAAPETTALSYTVVDTGQAACYDASGQSACPAEGEPFYGQDAQYSSNAPGYQDNGDGTVSDLVTGLMWSASPDLNGDGEIDAADKRTYSQVLEGTETFSLAGYEDWRLPSIKELYSLFLFSGIDLDPAFSGDVSSLTPFIDTDYFAFGYGDTSAGERIIDAQFATRTKYVSTTMNGAETMFGVNFADGRIKGYPIEPMPGQSEGKLFYVLYVRGNETYGLNEFVDNGNGTISDLATGLTWAQADSGMSMDWEAALDYCEALDLAGYSDWRLPDAKELHSILDYSRSPDTTGSAAIDPLFAVTAITNEAGQLDYPAFWSSSTHVSHMGGEYAAYVTFGRAMGYMNGRWMDVHGAGAVRSDPKQGDPDGWPTGHGPQGDAIRIENYVRCVRGGATSALVVSSQAETALESPQQPANPGGNPPARPEGAPDLHAAAQILGVSVDALREALGDPAQGRPDLQAAAAQLGVSVEDLAGALGVPPPPQ